MEKNKKTRHQKVKKLMSEPDESDTGQSDSDQTEGVRTKVQTKTGHHRTVKRTAEHPQGYSGNDRYGRAAKR